MQFPVPVIHICGIMGETEVNEMTAKKTIELEKYVSDISTALKIGISAASRAIYKPYEIGNINEIELEPKTTSSLADEILKLHVWCAAHSGNSISIPEDTYKATINNAVTTGVNIAAKNISEIERNTPLFSDAISTQILEIREEDTVEGKWAKANLNISR